MRAPVSTASYLTYTVLRICSRRHQELALAFVSAVEWLKRIKPEPSWQVFLCIVQSQVRYEYLAKCGHTQPAPAQESSEACQASQAPPSAIGNFPAKCCSASAATVRGTPPTVRSALTDSAKKNESHHLAIHLSVGGLTAHLHSHLVEEVVTLPSSCKLFLEVRDRQSYVYGRFPNAPVHFMLSYWVG